MIKVFFFITCFLVTHVLPNNHPDRAIVCVPVADLMQTPKQLDEKLHAPIINHDNVNGLITQLLFNEQVIIEKKEDSWVFVRTLEQQVYDRDIVTGCKGWVKKSQLKEITAFIKPNVIIHDHCVKIYADTLKRTILITVSIGTKFLAHKLNDQWFRVALPDGKTGYLEKKYTKSLSKTNVITEKLRDNIVLYALKMLDQPFCWYGRSSYDKDNKAQLTSLSCDGLVELTYRINGLTIPRFARDQYRAGKPVHGWQVKPGDLIFFGLKKNDYEPHHTMIYLGEGLLLEATFQSTKPLYLARIISCRQRLRKPIRAIRNGETFFGYYCVSFCTFF